ncbi:(2Fe-2S)-binding protein [Candidatus Pacearchaeota archaeon]|nr:(2Fe-2S)-binding protein [Candidatus Pacearchaeota archaeon]
MAELIKKKKSVHVKDGDKILDAAEELGVLFGCQDGRCGACRIEVLEGTENLSDRTEAEKDMELEPPFRLACQCRIKKGKVKIKV